MKYFTFLFFVGIIFIPQLLNAQTQFEGYYLNNGISPNNSDPFWLPNAREVQGITNDGKNWYLTVTGHEDALGIIYTARLWKIPMNVSLSASNIPSGAEYIDLEDIPDLYNGGPLSAVSDIFNGYGDPYWHWGDPDYYKYNGIEYILVPIYSQKGKDIIACFKASSLSFVSFTPWPYSPGWCAVDKNGDIFTSKNHPTSIDEFKIDWGILTKAGNQNAIIDKVESHSLKFNSNSYTKLMHMQGGEFTPSNELLYLVSGSAGGSIVGFDAGPGEPNPSDGIHVFRTSDWQEIETSVNVSNYWINSGTYNSVYFNYIFENDLTGESPEGLTIWKSKNTNPLGDLFVLLFDWDFQLIGANDHQASLFSFTNKVYLDSNASNNLDEANTGGANVPFQNLKDAVTYYPIWDGAELILKAGNYDGPNNQNILINKRVLITSQGGSAVIGRD